MYSLCNEFCVVLLKSTRSGFDQITHRSIWVNVHLFVHFVSSDELEDDETAMPSYIEAIVITDELFLDLRKQYVYCGSSERIELRLENGFVM